MGELLGALGLAWPRLLLYPGGLFALAAAWLLAWWLARAGSKADWVDQRAPPDAEGAPGRAAAPFFLHLVSFILPLCLLTLLPLPPARGFPFGLDLVVAVGLLELPRLLALGELRRGRLAREYGPLLVAALALATAAGGVELTRLQRLPETWPERVLLAAAAALWLLALPRLLAPLPPRPDGGPTSGAAPARPGASRGAHSAPAWRPLAVQAWGLRALGLLLIAALPLLGAIVAGTAELIPPGLAGWALPPAAILVAALLLGGLLRVPGRVRAGAELALGLLILGLLAWLAR